MVRKITFIFKNVTGISVRMSVTVEIIASVTALRLITAIMKYIEIHKIK